LVDPAGRICHSLGTITGISKAVTIRTRPGKKAAVDDRALRLIVYIDGKTGC